MAVSAGLYYVHKNIPQIRTCDKKPVRKELIEDFVIQEALYILKNHDIVEQLADRLYQMQGEESVYLQSLRKSLAEAKKSAANIMRAIEQGIITETTKTRLIELEEEQKKIEGEIGTEELRHPRMSRDEILFGIERFAKLDISSLEGRRKLIDGFINSVYLYDDKIVINFNGTREARTVSMEEIESSGSAEKPQPCEAPVEFGPFGFGHQQVFCLFIAYCEKYDYKKCLSKHREPRKAYEHYMCNIMFPKPQVFL